jgi:integrase
VEIDRRLCARFKAHKIAEREEIAAVLEAGADLRDMRGMRLRPLSNRSISMFCGLLGQILEQAVADELIMANPARGQHMKLASKKPVRTFLELDELADLLDTASALDGGESATTARVRELERSGKRPPSIAEGLGIAVSTVYYHLGKPTRPVGGARRAVVAGLGYAGLRVSELCDLERRSLRLHVGRLDVEDAKTPTGIREVDLTPVLRDELVAHRAWMASAGFDVSPRARVPVRRRWPAQPQQRASDAAGPSRANERASRGSRTKSAAARHAPHPAPDVYLDLAACLGRGRRVRDEPGGPCRRRARRCGSIRSC